MASRSEDDRGLGSFVSKTSSENMKNITNIFAQAAAGNRNRMQVGLIIIVLL